MVLRRGDLRWLVAKALAHLLALAPLANLMLATWQQSLGADPVAELTHRLLPGMIARRYGRIINVASLAGLVPGSAGHTLYGATKALLIKFSESLAMEGLPHNVHVTALCPGFTYSEFHDVNGTRALSTE